MVQENRNEFSDLTGLKSELSQLSPEDLMSVYNIYSQRLMHVIDVQWQLASIFIPLSLGGIVFLEQLKVFMIFVGLFSILLIWIWYLFERRNQRAIGRHQIILVAIESMLAKHEADKFGWGFSIPDRARYKKIGHTTLFRLTVYAVTLAWMVVIVFSTFDLFTNFIQ